MMRVWRRGGRDAPARRAAERRGRGAESLAALWLRLKGFRILARRLKTPVGEIDLIVRRGRLICFVEVKARPDPRDALASLSRAQRRRIEQAASWWLSRQTDAGGCDVRFDLIAVGTGHPPRHVADAWRPGL